LSAVNQPTVFKEYQPGDFASTVNAVNQFASELYQQYKNTTDNVFFSPYSISSALQMTYEGARGQTAQEMQNVFHFSGDEKHVLVLLPPFTIRLTLKMSVISFPLLMPSGRRKIILSCLII